MASMKDIGLGGTPIWGCPFTLRFPVGADGGDLETGLAAAADSEVSLDGGAFGDCTNEIVEIGTDGWYSITLEASEMQASTVAYKMISGSYGYHATIYPVRCGTVATGTAAAGGAATLTLAAGSVIVDDEYVGYILQLTGGTGSGQAARIIDAVASTRVLTVQDDWLTTPDATTTYAVLIPPERAALLSTVATDVAGLDGAAMRGTDGAYTGTPPTVEQIQSGLATETTLATVQERTDRLPDIPAATGDAMTLAPNAITAATIAAGAIADAALSADLDSYGARVEIIDDDGAETPADRYCVTWMRNQEMLTTGVTDANIRVVNMADGTDLVAETALDAVDDTGAYQYAETTNRIVDGAAYMVLVTATIAAATRTWPHFIGRDSAAT